MSEVGVYRVGALVTFTKQVSEADVALFELVTREMDGPPEEPPMLNRLPRKAAPYGLLGALLTVVVARLGQRPELARFAGQDVRFLAPIYVDDVLQVTAELTAYDAASGVLRARGRCENQDGLQLAEGEFTLVVE